MPYRKQNV
ncbi:hypothetical protein F383_17257 [Gossypium arboreum]|uniref:Uncharacterized protein n=1 Tax=Gossypium arboreum TaxID=29729 RepID=A0A0B0NNH8_GOSAR|nr:hypothetical protein F383_17257 [Gossypium arboreum]